MRRLFCIASALIIASLGCSRHFAPQEDVAAESATVPLAAFDPFPLEFSDRPKAKKADKVEKSKDVKSLPPGWYSDYAQALARAKVTGQPLLVLFH